MHGFLDSYRTEAWNTYREEKEGDRRNPSTWLWSIDLGSLLSGVIAGVSENRIRSLKRLTAYMAMIGFGSLLEGSKETEYMAQIL